MPTAAATAPANPSSKYLMHATPANAGPGVTTTMGTASRDCCLEILPRSWTRPCPITLRPTPVGRRSIRRRPTQPVQSLPRVPLPLPADQPGLRRGTSVSGNVGACRLTANFLGCLGRTPARSNGLGHPVSNGHVRQMQPRLHLLHDLGRAGRATHDAGAERRTIQGVEVGHAEVADAHGRHAVE